MDRAEPCFLGDCAPSLLAASSLPRVALGPADPLSASPVTVWPLPAAAPLLPPSRGASPSPAAAPSAHRLWEQEDAVAEVLRRLPWPSLLSSAAVCRLWSRVVARDGIWREKVAEALQGHYGGAPRAPTQRSRHADAETPAEAPRSPVPLAVDAPTGGREGGLWRGVLRELRQADREWPLPPLLAVRGVGCSSQEEGWGVEYTTGSDFFWFSKPFLPSSPAHEWLEYRLPPSSPLCLLGGVEVVLGGGQWNACTPHTLQVEVLLPNSPHRFLSPEFPLFDAPVSQLFRLPLSSLALGSHLRLHFRRAADRAAPPAPAAAAAAERLHPGEVQSPSEPPVHGPGAALPPAPATLRWSRMHDDCSPKAMWAGGAASAFVAAAEGRRCLLPFASDQCSSSSAGADQRERLQHPWGSSVECEAMQWEQPWAREGGEEGSVEADDDARSSVGDSCECMEVEGDGGAWPSFQQPVSAAGEVPGSRVAPAAGSAAGGSSRLLLASSSGSFSLDGAQCWGMAEGPQAPLEEPLEESADVGDTEEVRFCVERVRFLGVPLGAMESLPLLRASLLRYAAQQGCCGTATACGNTMDCGNMGVSCTPCNM